VQPFIDDETKSFFAGRLVLVSGASGHLGSQLVSQLLLCKAKVTLLVRYKKNLWRLPKAPLNIHEADLRTLNAGEISKVIGPQELVYHLAACGVNPHDCDEWTMMESNVMGTLNMLRLARHLKVRRLVHCGSCFEYGAGISLTEESPLRPVSLYGASKAAAGMVVDTFGRTHGLNTVTLRPFTFYGPFDNSQRLVASVISNIIQGKPVELTDGKACRDWVFVQDVVGAFLRAGMIKGIEGQVFNVSSGKSLSVRQVVEHIVPLVGLPADIRWGALPQRACELTVCCGNPDKAKALLSWQAGTGLSEGLKWTVDWFKKRAVNEN